MSTVSAWVMKPLFSTCRGRTPFGATDNREFGLPLRIADPRFWRLARPLQRHGRAAHNRASLRLHFDGYLDVRIRSYHSERIALPSAWFRTGLRQTAWSVRKACSNSTARSIRHSGNPQSSSPHYHSFAA